ncbi:GGDEF domain-containing protein [Quadrisphaera sp. INWT6]|nr:GGDEF domain-containing protein [Quadrisphaera sp. INWT6]
MRGLLRRAGGAGAPRLAPRRAALAALHAGVVGPHPRQQPRHPGRVRCRAALLPAARGGLRGAAAPPGRVAGGRSLLRRRAGARPVAAGAPGVPRGLGEPDGVHGHLRGAAQPRRGPPGGPPGGPAPAGRDRPGDGAPHPPRARRGPQHGSALRGGPDSSVPGHGADHRRPRPLQERQRRHGHPVGDAALSHVGRLLVGAAGAEAVVSRLGGDELAVLLPGATPLTGLLCSERAVEAVRSTPLELPDGGTLSLTVSIGVAHSPVDAPDVESLYRAADAALYEAKRGGRDQVAVAGRTGGPVLSPSS